MTTPNRTIEARARVEDRQVQVAELVLNGFSERQIARQLRTSPVTIHRDVVAVRKQWAEQRNATYETHIANQMQRLDQLERVIAREVAAGNLEAVDRALKILDRRARLLGLDAPTRHQVQVEDPISAEIRLLAEKLGVLDDPAVARALGGPESVVIEQDEAAN